VLIIFLFLLAMSRPPQPIIILMSLIEMRELNTCVTLWIFLLLFFSNIHNLNIFMQDKSSEILTHNASSVSEISQLYDLSLLDQKPLSSLRTLFAQW
jgi:hypothetical protein